jgi:hypothetical protein
VLSDEDAWGIVFDALANDDLTTDVEDVEDAVDRAACRAVCQFLFATSQPVDGLERGIFRGTDEYTFENSFEVVGAVQGREAGGHGRNWMLDASSWMLDAKLQQLPKIGGERASLASALALRAEEGGALAQDDAFDLRFADPARLALAVIDTERLRKVARLAAFVHKVA